MNRRIFFALLLSLYLFLSAGCAIKPYLVSNNFGNKDLSVVEIPKYQPSVINNSLYLNLHPNDIVIHVELHLNHFGHKEMVDFKYNAEKGLLAYTFNMQPKFTLTPESSEIICNITYLAYNKLYTSNKARDVHEIQVTEKTIRYHPVFKGERKDVPIKYITGQPLLSSGYPKLYTEIASLDGTQLKTIKKALSKDFISQIHSDDIKRHVATIQSILKMQGK